MATFNPGPGSRLRIGPAARAARLEIEVAESLVHRGLVHDTLPFGRHDVLVSPDELTKAARAAGIIRRPRLVPGNERSRSEVIA